MIRLPLALIALVLLALLTTPPTRLQQDDPPPIRPTVAPITTATPGPLPTDPGAPPVVLPKPLDPTGTLPPDSPPPVRPTIAPKPITLPVWR